MNRQSSPLLERLLLYVRVLIYESSASLGTCHPGDTEYLRLALSRWKVQVAPSPRAAPRVSGTDRRAGWAAGTNERDGRAGRQCMRNAGLEACAAWLSSKPTRKVPFQTHQTAFEPHAVPAPQAHGTYPREQSRHRCRPTAQQ